MRTILFITFFSMISLSIRGQIALETLAGNQQAHYINYIDKDLDSTAKWNFFNLNRFTVNYKDKALNNVSIEGQLTYQFRPWIGLSAGGGFYGELFVPTIGLSLAYMNKKEDFFIQMYPTIGFAEGQVAPSILGIIGYTPKFNKRWGFSSQAIFSADTFEASQFVRIGADYKGNIQFGIGLDLLQNFETKKLNYNLGPFIRFNY
ncbi:MAG: hypothetical protein ACOVQ4_12170 [Flectobacillus sp.]|jgi:hypothetical protein|uniref:hypothetical protein n=1 Tax=Flectobacillus sp. TaxID=50419 RepID=UPI003B9AA362